ncbi:MAG TPA: tRNA preQ1(34) S-adenosylmethionine ribosyltransferase-isomerase QueA [Polyangiales bacterium]
MRAEELDYDLPPALIAQEPPPVREAARLLVMERGHDGVQHARIAELPRLLPPSLFVFNDTKVIPARLLGHKPSGGRFELLLVERLRADEGAQRWLCMGKPLKSLRGTLEVGPLTIEVGPRHGETLIEVTLRAPDVERALHEVGQMPLPPYIARQPSAADRERYQTVFARTPGAVAAPTAGLHFGDTLLQALEDAGHQRAFVTLHVGPGTFAPLGVDDLREHPMHAEHYEISEQTARAIAAARREGRPIVAVGTTVVRTLEASLRKHGVVTAGADSTSLFLYPPQELRAIDALITNFHLPRSTLLALVMAFAGIEPTRAAYRAAVQNEYRFFSYGDAMLIRGGQ